MKYNQPFDQPSNPNAPYVDGNPAAGIQGSIVPAAAIEYDQREIVNTISAVGLSPTNADLTQLLQALKLIDVNNVFKCSNNLGNASQWSASIPTLPIMPPPLGTAIWFKPGFASVKGGTVFSVNGSPFRNVTHLDGSPIDIGDVVATAWVLLFFDGTNWQVPGPGVVSRQGTLPLLQKNADWYINSSTGDDTLYDGTSPTILSSTVGPFRTIQRGVDETAKYNMNGYSQLIHCADGIYTPFVAQITNGVGWCYIIGNQANPQNCQITATGALQCCAFFLGGHYAMNGFRLATTPSALDCIAANGSGCNVDIYGSMQMGPAARAHFSTAWSARFVLDSGLQVIVENGGNALYHLLAEFNSNLSVPNPPGPSGYPVITFQGPVTFTDFIWADDGSATFILYANYIGAGNVTGRRYVASLNGVINANSYGVNYYPGTVAGILQSGGQYG
jgi:hypothetical protein